MRICRTYGFKGGIKGVQTGWSLAGPPLMSVYFYLFGRVMVDTGQSRMAREAVEIARFHRVDRIFLTHHHEDHSGNAAKIREKMGAEVVGHEETRAKMIRPYAILPYQKYMWGRTSPVPISPLPTQAETPLGPLIPVHTPGHSRDHTCYHLPDQGVLFSGDLYLGDRIKFFRSDENLAGQIASLKKILTLDFDTLLCGHNPKAGKGPCHIRAKLGFLEDLYGRVAGLQDQGLRPEEILATLRLKEDRLIKWFCFGNVSMLNGVRSIVRSRGGTDP